MAIYFQDGTNETHTGRRRASSTDRTEGGAKARSDARNQHVPGTALGPGSRGTCTDSSPSDSSPVELDVVIHNGVTLEVSWGLSGLKKHQLKTVSPKQPKASKWNGQWNTRSPACCSRWSSLQVAPTVADGGRCRTNQSQCAVSSQPSSSFRSRCPSWLPNGSHRNESGSTVGSIT